MYMNVQKCTFASFFPNTISLLYCSYIKYDAKFKIRTSRIKLRKIDGG